MSQVGRVSTLFWMNCLPSVLRVCIADVSWTNSWRPAQDWQCLFFFFLNYHFASANIAFAYVDFKYFHSDVGVAAQKWAVSSKSLVGSFDPQKAPLWKWHGKQGFVVWQTNNSTCWTFWVCRMFQKSQIKLCEEAGGKGGVGLDFWGLLCNGEFSWCGFWLHLFHLFK